MIEIRFLWKFYLEICNFILTKQFFYVNIQTEKRNRNISIIKSERKICMQYETIILELLSRIKKLEEEVAELKQALLSSSSVSISEDAIVNISGERNDGAASYTKMTDEMIDMCYKCGKKLASGENAQELADDIAESTGMNRNSAIMYLYAVQGMLDGTIYKRAISAKAMRRYYDTIWNESGSAGLKKAIKATRLHIDYRRECGHTVDSIEEICNQYERKL